jgi:hypothetical protein
LIETGFGDVVADGLLKRSGTGPYAGLTRAVAAGTRKTYAKGRTSHPRVIAEVVGTAVSAARPRTRYVRGRFGALLIAMRTWLGDRLFDRIILSQLPKGA